MNEKNEITVVLPTLGRKTLKRSLESIYQDDGSIRIIVVTAAQDLERTSSILNDFLFTTPMKISVETTATRNVSSSFNVGMQNVKTKYFTFFSDDDFWVKGRTKNQVEFLEKHSEFSGVLGSVIFYDGKKKILRPTDFIEKSVIEILKNKWWKRGSYYLSLTSFLGREELRSIKFRQDLNFWEDISWLIDCENLNHKFTQTNTIGAHVNAGYIRGYSRETSSQYLNICKNVLRNDKRACADFLRNVATKNHVHSGHPIRVARVFLIGVKSKVGIVFYEKTFSFLFAFFAASIRKTIIFLLRK